MSLIKLDSGDFVDPKIITAIRCEKVDSSPRVIIDTTIMIGHFVIYKDSLTDCFEYAGKIAFETLS